MLDRLMVWFFIGLLLIGAIVLMIGLPLAGHAALLWLLQSWSWMDTTVTAEAAYLWWALGMFFFPLLPLAAVQVVNTVHLWIWKQPLPNTARHPFSVGLSLFVLGLYFSQLGSQITAIHLSTPAVIALAMGYTAVFQLICWTQPTWVRWIRRG